MNPLYTAHGPVQWASTWPTRHTETIRPRESNFGSDLARKPPLLAIRLQGMADLAGMRALSSEPARGSNIACACAAEVDIMLSPGSDRGPT